MNLDVSDDALDAVAVQDVGHAQRPAVETDGEDDEQDHASAAGGVARGTGQSLLALRRLTHSWLH